MNIQNVIFTTCVDYDVGHVKPFFTSCRKYFHGRIVVVCPHPSDDLKSFFVSHNVEVISPITSFESRGRVMTERFRTMFNFITKEISNFDQCFFTDVRDVLFQGNPFVGASLKLRVFEESKLIVDCKINREWVEKAYGKAVFEQVKNYRALCAGTTFASYDGACEYLQLLLSEADKIGAKWTGLDQAIHNVIVRTEKISGVKVEQNGFSAVQTMSGQTRFVFDENWNIINFDGTQCPVLHQYDRHPILRERYLGSEGHTDPMRIELARLRKYEKTMKSSRKTFKHLVKMMVSK